MDAIQLIELYDTMFYVFMGIAILGFVLAVFSFFYFDIPGIYAMETGRAREATIRRMAEQNARTGKLRADYGSTGKTAQTGGKPQAADLKNGETARLSPAPEEAETTILQAESEETTILQQKSFRFEITENTIVIHTDEMI